MYIVFIFISHSSKQNPWGTDISEVVVVSHNGEKKNDRVYFLACTVKHLRHKEGRVMFESHFVVG